MPSATFAEANFEFQGLSEKSVLAALDDGGADHPIAAEVARLITAYVAVLDRHTAAPEALAFAPRWPIEAVAAAFVIEAAALHAEARTAAAAPFEAPAPSFATAARSFAVEGPVFAASATRRSNLAAAAPQRTGAQKTGGHVQPSPLYRARANRMERVIMIVDDNRDTCAVLKESLERYGECIVLHEADGILETYLETSPDIVFLDMNFPGGSGLDVLARLKHCDKDAHVVMMTGDGTASNAAAAKSGGARSFLGKPFDLPRLGQEVAACRTMRRAAGARRQGASA